MQIAIASGKGGTGKTTVAVNLAYALKARGEKIRLFDCDVEEPNDHLFVQEEFVEEIPVDVVKPEVDLKKCIACGKCSNACAYKALALIKNKLLVFDELCHSCGLCFYLCPEEALIGKRVSIGSVKKTKKNQYFELKSK